tara:strand:- start:2027 stop:2452 length:426 start_codon:yes stop_codon:yes gene_type:complete
MIEEKIFTASQVAALLEIEPNTITKLARHGILPGTRKDKRWVFNRFAVHGLVQTHPYYFGGRPFDNLFFLLKDAKLCQRLSEMPRMLCNCKPVRHIESGRVYQSQRKAAEAYGIDTSSICYCARGYNQTTSAGRFEYIYPN